KNYNENDFKSKILPNIRFIKSKLAYSAGNKHISKKFKDYMDSEINKINSIQDFALFLKHYQAIIAYYTYNEFEYKEQKRGEKK
ncbi:MAG: type III-A CRISPR-associated protein Csm2, partial [Spirochaetota bacterium]|nr:type III-A CRISPR-associated protein Csm2 [Spirochaetota bacterium]